MGHSRAFRYAAALSLGIAFPVSASSSKTFNASGVTAGVLAQECAGHKSLSLDGCGGYIFGASDAVAAAGVICRPDNPTTGNLQTEAIVRKYLRDHPEEWSFLGSYVITKALKEAFPCRK